MKRKFVFGFAALALGYISVCVNASDTTFSQDTYADALQNSHKTDFDSTGGAYDYSPPQDNNYLPPPASPGYDYSPPNSYLPPAPSPPPPPVYGPPGPAYLPPTPYYKPPLHIPYQSHDSFLAKLKSKISLFTIGKLLLKLLIFKKIVKFIGIICLLLVLPKLKNLFSDNMSMEDEGMVSKTAETDKDKLEKQIDDLYDFITSSIHDFEKKYT